MKNLLVSFNVPARDASLDVWKDFIAVADWQVVRDIKQVFKVRRSTPYEDHDKELVLLLWERLFQFEQPVLNEAFLEEEAPNAIFVEDGISQDELKAQIASMEPFPKAKYVVEKGGKLRGFALTKDLILMGRTVSRTHAGGMEPLLRQYNHAELLTFGESVIVRMHYDELCDMMEKVGVPSLRGVDFWMLDSLDSLCAGNYAVFVPNGALCLASVEVDYPVLAVAKL